MKIRYFVIPAIVILTLSLGWKYFDSAQNSTIDYSTQVKPIINKHCISCHGGVKRNADFSLLFRADALAKTK